MFTSVSPLFKENFNLSISIFDNSRGKSEGDEYEKVLCFYPPNVSENVQCSIVGLAQAIITFSNTFSKDEGFGYMEAENNKWIAYNCEPNIWLLLVIRKSWVGQTCSNEALNMFLKRAHSTFVLLSGSITNLLQQDETGDRARMLLQAYMQDLAELVQPVDSQGFAELTNPLCVFHSCPMIPLSRKAYLGVQSMVNNLLILNIYGARILSGLVLMYGPALLWSTLPEEDTQRLYAYAHNGLLPRAKEQAAASAATKLGGLFASAAAGVSASSGSISGRHTSEVISEFGMGLLLSSRWLAQPGGFLAPESMLRRAGPATRSSGFQDAMAPLFEAPRMWLQGGTEPCRLLPYQHNHVTLLLLLHDNITVSQDVLSALQEEIAPRCVPLAELLSRQVPSTNLWHIPGYRYLYTDHLTAACRGSPANKVATLNPASKAALTQLRNTVDQDHSEAPAESDMEVFCRTHQDCWLVSRRSGPRELYIAMEAEREGSLLAVADKVQTLCDEEFPGVFEI